MLTEALLSTVTEKIFGFLLENSGLTDKVIRWLGRDSQQLAFKIALTKTYTAFSEKHPEWVGSLFDEHFITHKASPILALCVQRASRARSEDLAKAWADQFGGQDNAQSELIATDFLRIFNAELRKQIEFQPLFDSRALDAIAETSEYTAQTIATLQAELSQSLEAARSIITESERSIAVDRIIDSTVITGDLIFQRFNEASVPISKHIKIKAFQTMVKERTKRFVGREFVFQTIDDLLVNPDFPSGYIVISGEPGIGKTALIAEMVNRYGYVHHFNSAPQNIRYTRDFLKNVCAQLIVRYDLKHYMLPSEVGRHSGFLSQLLSEAIEKADIASVVILIDALDEVDYIDLPLGVNILYLPPALPDNVYFVVSTRAQKDIRLVVDRRKNIYISDDDPFNLEDVKQYIRNFLNEYRAKINHRIEKSGVEEDEFMEVITEKSEGNFMYLVYVLRDIRDGKLTTENIDDIRNLPQGLQDYYKRHWYAMRVQNEEQFDRYQEPVVCILAAVQEPVTIADLQGWTELEPKRIKWVIDEWIEFLNVDETEAEPLYRIYHASFQDFLKKEVEIAKYHDKIAERALAKIPGLCNDCKT
ncbi:MAG: ATP-binding protein [Desulfuromusa sp.]|nr:ATP-binding protein [Desulfuromusa sp.]